MRVDDHGVCTLVNIGNPASILTDSRRSASQCFSPLLPLQKNENCWRFIKSSGVSCGFKEGCLSFDMGSLSLPGHWFGASQVECCFFLYKLVFCLSLPDRHHHQQCEHLPVPDRGHGSGVVRQGLARSAKRWHEETNLPARDSHPGSFYICFQNHQPLHIYLDLHECLAQ